MILSRVLVIGGQSAIGTATIRALVAAGMRPIVTDVAVPQAGSRIDGATVWEVPFDVSDATAVGRGIAAIEATLGTLDGLVNATGILGRPPLAGEAPTVDRVSEIAAELRDTYVTCREVGARMAARGHGAIVNIASVVPLRPAAMDSYNPASAAVAHLTTTLAAELGRQGVRVNAVWPGFTAGEPEPRTADTAERYANRIADLSALGRLVYPDEVGRVIAWLLGEGAAAITGVNLPVDAGFLCGVSWQAVSGLREPATVN